MSDEFFYGVTLSETSKTTVWNPIEEKDEGDDVGEFQERPNKLIIKQILLGVDAKDEYSVVEVKTITREESTQIPIAVLKPGECRYANLFLEFPDAPVTFVLTRGSGPVHIHGQHLTGDFDNMEDDLDDEALDDEEDTDNEIRADEEEEPKPKKAKLAGNNVVKKEKNNKKK